MIVIHGKELLFDNYCWHEYIKRVDWGNPGSYNQAALFAALASGAYSNGEECISWKDSGAMWRKMTDDEKKKLKSAFEEMQEFKLFVKELEKQLAEEKPEESKKKPLKASVTT